MNTAQRGLRSVEMSLALRVAVAVALFGLVLAGAAAVSGYWALSRQLDGRLEAELLGKRNLLLHLLAEMPEVQAIPDYGHRFGDLLIGHEDLHLALVDPSDRRLLAGFSPIAAASVAQFMPPGRSAAAHWVAADGRRYASLAGEAPVRDGGKVFYIVTIDPEDDRRLLQGFVGAIALGLPLLLAVVAFGAWLVARTGLAPLNRLTLMASRVTTQTLAQRIETEHLPKELAQLAQAFNSMLQRIDDGVNRLSEFSADLAHEMRTPVATLMGRTQVALSKRRSVEELQDVLAGNVEELDRLTRLIADMLFLAQTDQGAAPLQREAIDLSAEARRITDFLSVLAEERGVRVEVSGQATVLGDRILIQRAITNLLSNAIRHSTAPGTVAVHVRQHGGGAVQLDVSNLGSGIPADQAERVFERFVRLDAGRGRSDGGSGLGLAIVKSVMHAHGGQVQLDSQVGGLTTFSLCFGTQTPPAVVPDRENE